MCVIMLVHVCLVRSSCEYYFFGLLLFWVIASFVCVIKKILCLLLSAAAV